MDADGLTRSVDGGREPCMDDAVGRRPQTAWKLPLPQALEDATRLPQRPQGLLLNTTKQRLPLGGGLDKPHKGTTDRQTRPRDHRR
jgi:hypothetical protein